MKYKLIFVSGIDTNIGKSYATAYLSRVLQQEEGYGRIITQKMIQTGNKDVSEDILLHRKLLDQELLPADKDKTTAPLILSYPASPHLSARIDGVEIDLSRLNEATLRLFDTYHYDHVLLEGAGGLMVPITKDYLTIDYIQEMKYPVALVTSGRLGSINHTLLSLEACQRRDIDVPFLIYNHYPSVDKIIELDTLEYLTDYLGCHFPSTRLLEMEQWTEE